MLFAGDTFAGRSTTNGWESASDGNAWSVQAGDAALLSVAGGRGLVNGSNAMATVRATLGAGVASDTEAIARYTSGDYANDAGHLVARFSNAGTYYAAGLDSPNGAPELNVMKVVNGAQTRVANTSFAATNGTGYWERIRVQGSSVSVRAWQDGTTEPRTWNLTWTDPSPLPAGRASIESWDDGRGWAIDHFSAGKLS